MPDRQQRQPLSEGGQIAPRRRRLLAAAALTVLEGSSSVSRAASAAASGPGFAPRIRAPWAPPPLDAARERERQVWLAQGEASLAALDTDAAEQAFDRAGRIAHAADAEIGIARTHMQRGDYGRAMASAAHTGGDHPESAVGTALHAWLLRLAGDAAGATQVLATARSPDDGRGVISATRAAMALAEPIADGPLLQAPARLAPFGSMTGLAGRRRVVSSGSLVADGRLALAPAVGALRASGARRVFVRDGLGRLSPATVVRRAEGFVLLRLAEPWPVSTAVERSPMDAFPGSVAHAAHQVVVGDALPRWPLLATGFVGAPVGGGRRALAWGSQRSPGGPVLDVAMRVVGVVAHRPGSAAVELVGCAELERRFGQSLFVLASPAASPAPRTGIERIYETAMRVSLQVIA